MNDEIKFYISSDTIIDNVEILEKMLSLISKDNVKLKKNKNIIEAYNVSEEGFIKLAVSLNPLKNDLKLDQLSLIVTPVFNDGLVWLIEESNNEVCYLLDLLLRKIKAKDIKYEALKNIFKKINKETIDTIKNYINLNQSVKKTSEVMFTHRNTINYRINKFIHLTGINIRQHSNAMFVYVVLELINS